VAKRSWRNNYRYEQTVLFLLDYNSGLGVAGFGNAQRSEHILRALQSVGNCDVALLYRESASLEKITVPDVRLIKRLLNPGENVYVYSRHCRPLMFWRKCVRKTVKMLNVGRHVGIVVHHLDELVNAIDRFRSNPSYLADRRKEFAADLLYNAGHAAQASVEIIFRLLRERSAVE
jgi:hypothetical protein